MASRDSYRVTGRNIEEIKLTLNFALQRIADRLDKLEGIRGKTDFDAAGLDVVGDVAVRDADEELIHSME